MQHIEFETLTHDIQRINPDDVRHIEDTTDQHGLDIFVLHFKSHDGETEVLHTDNNASKIGQLLISHGYLRLAN